MFGGRIKIDPFLVGMIVAVALAWVFPDPGAQGGALHPELLTKLGVALIFFFHGMALSFTALKAGTLQWRLHLIVQVCTYVLFPALGLLFLFPMRERMSADLQLGFFYLCVLPSTVSSSVALTAAARGNVPAALFNATLSSLLGVFLTPMWISLKLTTTGQSLPLGSVLLDLFLWLVLPLLAGQVMRRWLAEWASRNKRLIYLVDRGTILLLVYTSFCDSVKWGVWSQHGSSSVLYAFAGSLLLFSAMFAVVNAVCVRMRLSTPDLIAAVFCGSKKTLASGVPMAQLIFGSSNPALSLILLPIMIYHPLQLIICGALANRWARRKDARSGQARP